MGSLHDLRPVKAAPLCVAALAITLASACSGRPDAAVPAGRGAGPGAAAPATIEQLASRTGCALTGKRDSAELRQGACRTGLGRYTLVGFSTDRGLNAWLEEAKPWGGSYLVGTRWVAVGTPRTLESLRGRVGGHIMTGAHHG